MELSREDLRKKFAVFKFKELQEQVQKFETMMLNMHPDNYKPIRDWLAEAKQELVYRTIEGETT